MDDTEPRQYNSSTVSNAAVRNTQPQITSGVTNLMHAATPLKIVRTTYKNSNFSKAKHAP